MKKKIVIAIAIGLCTATLGNSFAKDSTKAAVTPQDTTSVRRLPPLSRPPQDSTDTQILRSPKLPTTSPQNPNTPQTSPDSSQRADSVNVD
ncbi:MAG TPA: hypothetical protein VFL76_01785 [Edaphocola sp.]|nr:hypothetical protein [Edaphocola sp.]